MRPCVLLPLAALLASCGSAKAPTTGADAVPTQQQQAALLEVNRFRSQAGIAGLSINQALDIAATRHAGYQVLEQPAAPPALTHNETDTGNALYTAFDFGARIRAANGGHDLYSPGHVYYEGISSDGQPTSIGSLWNTVYHRLPMSRHESILFGYGEDETARTVFPEAHVPDTSANPNLAYATCEFAGPGGTTITASWWPSNGVTNVATEFDPHQESPDPFSGSNSGQSPAMPSDDKVGPPFHIIAPTSQEWASATITLALQSTPAVQIPVYVLVGYGHPDPSHFDDPTANPPPAPTTFVPTGSVTAWAYDVELDVGEIFVMAVDPLTNATGYQYSVSATTHGGSPDMINTNTVLFTTH
jgi:hypothetical protein